MLTCLSSENEGCVTLVVGQVGVKVTESSQHLQNGQETIGTGVT